MIMNLLLRFKKYKLSIIIALMRMVGVLYERLSQNIASSLVCHKIVKDSKHLIGLTPKKL